MSESGFSNPVKDFILDYDNNKTNIINTLKVAQERVWKETQENFTLIKKLLP